MILREVSFNMQYIETESINIIVINMNCILRGERFLYNGKRYRRKTSDSN